MSQRSAVFGAAAARIESHLDEWSAGLGLPGNLQEALRYALLAGGKRLRPALAWHAAEAAGGRGEDALVAGLAVELVHTFSLVHDDLPSMDDDDLRRGRPTLHIHAGEAMAVLAGDSMMSLAFQALVEKGDSALGSSLVAELSAATTAMIAGQVYDTLGGFAPGLDEAARLELVHRNKTGALIRAACRMGAMCGGGGDGALGAITGYGEAIGLMFQIVDDLIDVEGASEHVGKRTRKDADAGKLTWPGVFGVEGSRRKVRELEARAQGALAPLGERASGLREIAGMMARRTR